MGNTSMSVLTGLQTLFLNSNSETLLIRLNNKHENVAVLVAGSMTPEPHHRAQ